MARTATRSFTGPAGITPGQFNLSGRAVHGLHKRDGDIITQIIPGNRTVPPRPCPFPSAEQIAEQVTETGKDILKITRTLVAATLQAFMPIGIIDLALLDITEDFIGLGTLLKTGLGLLIIRISVRMVLHGQCPVSLLDLTAAGSPTYRQYIVIISWHSSNLLPIDQEPS
jgi:hypothetical protein